MIELYGDLWSELGSADIVCVTTNGYVKQNGRAVMGRGCALQACKRFQDIDAILGAHIQRRGNVVGQVWINPVIYSLPVKHNWWEPADPVLVIQSCERLAELADHLRWQRVVLPRPGCGNGQLRWVDVQMMIGPLLDNRFVVYALPTEKGQ
jgi:hypothetical protein